MEKIQMKHTDPSKKTVAMEKEKYETLKRSLLKAFESQQEMTFKEMVNQVTGDLKARGIAFEGSVQWHMAWVQMDMEARKELTKDATKSPQVFWLAK